MTDSQKQGYAWGLLIVGLCSLLVFLFYPFILLPEHSIPSDFPDSHVFTWNFWWARYAFEHGSPLFYTDAIFYPRGASLLLHTYVPAISIPLSVLFGSLFTPWQLYTVAVLGCLILNTLTAFRLFSGISKELPCAFLLSFFISFHPFVMGHLRGGHLNFLVLFPLFFTLDCMLRALHEKRQPIIRLFTMIASIVFMLWTNEYYLYFFLMLATTMIAAVMIGSPDRRKLCLRVWVAPLFGAGLLCIPRALTLFKAASSGKFTAHHDPYVHSADLFNYMLPTSLQRLHYAESWIMFKGVNIAENGLAITIGLALALGICLRHLKRESIVFLCAAALFFFCSFGPVISIADYRLLPNPLYHLLALLPQFPSTPIRFGYMVLVCVCVVITIQVRKGSPSYKPILFCLCLACIEVFPVAPVGVTMHASPVVQSLAEKDDSYVLHDIAGWHEHAMTRQIFHERKLLQGFLARRPKRRARWFRRNDFLMYISGVTPGPCDALHSAFKATGITGILASKDPESSQAAIVAALEQCSFLTVVAEDRQFSLYEDNNT